MNTTARNNNEWYKFIDQAVDVFGYFDLILQQLKADSAESFSHSLFIFKKVTESLQYNFNGTILGDLVDKDIRLCKGKLSELIILLQFEDILHQKFDHISIINKMIIEELKNNNDLSQDNKSLLLKKIIVLNSAQLEQIREEHKNICSTMKDKLEDIYATSDNLLSALKAHKGDMVNFFMLKLNGPMKLIRNFIDSDVVRFSQKIDTLIRIYEGLDINIFSSFNVKISGFDLGKLLKVYTMESERKVFFEALGECEDSEIEKMKQEPTDDSVNLF